MMQIADYHWLILLVIISIYHGYIFETIEYQISFVSQSYDSSFKLLNKLLTGFINSSMKPVEASFTPDSKFILCGSDDGFIHIWSAEDFLKVAKIPSKHKKSIRFVKFNPKHNMFASSCSVTCFWIPEQKISPKIKN